MSFDHFSGELIRNCVVSTVPSAGAACDLNIILFVLKVNSAIREDMSTIKIGMANLFIQHTSASLTINENADPDVRR